MTQTGRFAACVAILCFASIVSGQVVLSPNPSRVLGHPQAALKTANPNYVEGKELYQPWGVAVDGSSNPPHLYVADGQNNRVLAWRNASGFATGDAADMVIGQQDLYGTMPQGPGATIQTGVYLPTGLAVSPQGDLYIADSANNRILRFPKPFDNPLPALPDLVIGQQNFQTKTPNVDPDTRTISDRTLLLSTGSAFYVVPLVFDADGNLFVGDAGNQRVLRFPVSLIGPSATNMPKADLVLGQPNFTQYPPRDPSNTGDLNSMGSPSGLAFDSTRRLYVSDDRHRVLVYPSVMFNGAAALRKLGGVGNAQGNLQPPTQQSLYKPTGIFFVADRPYVVDSGNHRIVRFRKFEDWPTDGSAPFADDLIGQNSYADYRPNRDAVWPVTMVGSTPAVSFSYPGFGVAAGGELFVSDTYNHRVVVLPDPAVTSGSAMYAKRVAGQQYLDDNGPNRVEARGFFFGGYSAGLAVDTKSNPPHLYVADALNNRILGFRDVRTAKLGDTADIVLGQESFHRAAVNWAATNAGQPSEYGLNQPQGLAVDAQGNLWVADSGNGRVLRFPSPFDHASSAPADLVLGKRSFTATQDSAPDPSDENFYYPVGLAFTSGGHLLVSDAAFHRVLLFLKPDGGFVSRMKASRVFGQAGFFDRTAATSDTDRQHFNTPLQISADQSDRLFVCDYGLNRVLIFDSITERANGTSADTSITDIASLGRLNGPRGVYSSPATGETWIASGTSAGQGLLRIRGSFTSPDFFIGGSAAETALGVTTTGSGDALVAFSTHRVVFYSPASTITNAANYEPELAPGMYASLWPFPGFVFPVTTTTAPSVPLPKDLSDVQLLINGQAAPLHFVSPGQINFLIPQNAPSSGDMDVKLVRKSTNETLAVGCSQNASKSSCQTPYLALQGSSTSVGLFTSDSSGRNQIRALNMKSDGTYYGGCTGDNITPCLNSATNPIKGGDFLEIYLTGQGLDINGTYADGAAPGQGLTTKRLPQVYLGPQRKLLADSDVLYSGMNPFYPGLWQINIRIPKGEGAPIGNTVPIQIIYRSSDSWRGTKFLQTIAVTQ